MKRLIPLVLVVVPAVAWASTGAPVRPLTTLRVAAEATVSQLPDRVYLDVGVKTESRHPRAAATRNADVTSSVLAAVRRAAGPGTVLTTSNYSVVPQYRYSTAGRPPTLTGYEVSNVVRIRLNDLKRVAAVIDAAAAAGANLQRNLHFGLRDPQAARLRALARAARRARAAARTLAAALGLRIVRIASVRETGAMVPPSPSPRFDQQAVRMQPRSTPVEWGAIHVTAGVSLKVVAAPR